jgi:hypothetical protein
MNKLDLDMTGMQFTRRWFRQRNMRTFIKYVYPEFADKPILYLEIGVFEGMSMAWMLQKVLTHPDSLAVGIDPWVAHARTKGNVMSQVKERAFSNLAPWLNSGKLALYNFSSNSILKDMTQSYCYLFKPGEVDLCMVDGDHHAPAVLEDARYVLQLLKPGGVMLFDDVEGMKAKVGVVREGVDLFLAEAGDKVSLAWKEGHMECYRKVS